MIKNQKQYALTKRRVDEFESTISELKAAYDTDVPFMVKIQIDALECQKEQLEAEVYEYDKLVSGDYAVFDVDSFSELPKALIRARIALGLTQKDLADRLGLKEQQIQRYENTEYSSAAFGRLIAIVDALDLKVKEDVFLPKKSRDKNLVMERLRDVGLSTSFINKRLVPQFIENSDYTGWIDSVVAKCTHIFGWGRDELLGTDSLVIGRDASMLARFKMPAGASSKYVTAYTQYAFTVAGLLPLCAMSQIKELSDDPVAVRKILFSDYGGIGYQSVLNFIADRGVLVVALDDKGAFHGATWRVKGRNIIVLKQQSKYEARWVFDLLHEYFHAAQRPELDEFALVELEETSPERREDPEEIAANSFAASVLLGENYEGLISSCFKQAKGNISFLKSSVQKVAEQYKVDVGVLANQVAYRVYESQSANWWGAANNLQISDHDLMEKTRLKLLEVISLDKLDGLSRDILEQAIYY